MHWPRTNLKSANAAPIVPGTTTCPPSARPRITSAPSLPRAGAEYPVIIGSSVIKCPTPALTEDDVATPTATTSPANAMLATSPWKSEPSNTTITTRGVMTSAKESLAAQELPCARQSPRSSWTSSRTRAPLMPLVPLPPTMTMSPAITRDRISAWKRSFEGRVVISSISSTERGEVFYGPTDWLGSRDPMTPVRYTRGSPTGLDD
jgi:hypothetical protein